MADYQSEAQLEAGLVKRLHGLGWEPVIINDGNALRANLKKQLELHNKVQLTDAEFAQVINHLDKGNVFDKALILRDRMHLKRDNGTPLYLQFLNSDEWCRNQYQVTTQVSQTGSYDNRYDVTLLVNGLPLVQIELKRRGIELKEAFNQINRYQRHSFWAENGLFQYVQLFVISNGVNTKYYANNRNQHFNQTFYWADEKNNLITQLDAFADVFLEKCHLSKMISKYIVLNQSKVMMVLRPYQYYAAEAIAEQVKNGRENGYIWHTTGSGKTLTSFKAAQLLLDNPKVHKVLFVVDRNDLDYQTQKEFNAFSEGSVDNTDNTHALVKQLTGHNRLIVTTIQKLNNAIKREHHKALLDDIKNQRVVFIFDECHRSQFGDTHKEIVNFFTKAQLFGFTGTPILAENANKNRTTEDLFGDCLHKYVITDAIRDGNVLRFAVEYWGKLKYKDGGDFDEEVSGIDLQEFFNHPDRLDRVTDWIIENHNRKTHDKDFSAIFCVSSKDAAIAYYDLFKQKRLEGKHDLRITTIFTYAANEDDSDATGEIGDPDIDFINNKPINVHTRDKLESYVQDYNEIYKTKHSIKDSKGFYTYYNEISDRLKNREKQGAEPKDRLDILLVVNMFLTGFDAKKINTLYVDKNLRYHGLIQAFSRTNRIFDSKKSQGNIFCFRNLKEQADAAITLYSNKDAITTVLMAPYEEYIEEFNKAVAELFSIAPDVDAVNKLQSEEEVLAFVQAFRKLIRLHNVLTSFAEFEQTDLDIETQTFEDFKSKYLDIYERSRRDNNEEKASIVNEVDFELELIQRDEINVAYILSLLGQAMEEGNSLDTHQQDEAAKKQKLIRDLLSNEPRLRSKRELLERFIDDYMPKLSPSDSVQSAFHDYWEKQKETALNEICISENLDRDKFHHLMEEYYFTERMPIDRDIVSTLKTVPRILERKSIVQRVSDKFKNYIQTFDDGMGDV